MHPSGAGAASAALEEGHPMHVCNLRSAFGAAAVTLVLLTSACSRQSRPATPGRSPTFESSVPSEAASAEKRVDEQNLCDTLTEGAKARVEDSPGGAVITFVARRGGITQPLRNDVL